MISIYVKTPSQCEPVRKVFARPQLNCLILIVMWFLLRDATATWNFTSQLPINAQTYPQISADVTRQIVTIAHSVTNGIPRGKTFRLQVLVPPGANTVTITAQSNNWQCAPDPVTGSPSPLRCPIMGGFDHDPGEFCTRNPSAQEPTPCGNGTFVYPQDLHTVTARLSDILYPTESSSPQVTIKPRYVYFVLYQQPQANSDFYFGSNLGITFGISGIQSYTRWREVRPWAGGPPENSIDGIDDDIKPNFTLTLSVIQDSATNGSVTSNPAGIQCGGTMGTANCKATYTANTQVTLTASAQAGSRFVSWSDGCGSTNNVTLLTMNSDKTCSATFEKIPENPPEIELFDGKNHLSDGSPTPIQFGSTPEGKPITKELTIQNIGMGDLNLTSPILPPGFSLVSSFPNLILANSSTLIKIQLDAITPGTYSGDLEINNNDADENPFNLALEGTVFDKFNLNEGKQEFGNRGIPFFSDKVEIVVTANLQNETGIFEPLTREGTLKVPAGRSVDINAIITPDPIHKPIDVVVIAGWDNQEQPQFGSALQQWSWYQKTPTSTLLGNTGWIEWFPDLSKLHVIPYGTFTGKESYSVNLFTGKLVPPSIEGFGQAKHVHFFVGYGIWAAPINAADDPQGRFVYVVSQPITFQLPLPLTPESIEIKVDEFKVISPQAGSEGKITACQISNQEIVAVSFNNFACGLVGLKLGSTILTVQGTDPNSSAETTINVVE